MLPAIKDERRYQILGVEQKDTGGLTHFEKATIPQLRELLENGYVDLDGNHNSSPSVREILDMANRIGYQNLTLNGYIVSAKRGDCRISIDGITVYNNQLKAIGKVEQEGPQGMNPETLELLSNWAKSADEVDRNFNSVYLWWD